MSDVRITESSKHILAVVDHTPMAMAWPLGDGRWAVQHRGEPDPRVASDREVAEHWLVEMFATPA
jgi:hypothetical protein